MNQVNHQHKIFFKSSFLDILYVENRFLLAIMEKTACYYGLNDNRKVQGIWTQSIKWLENDCLPRGSTIGIRVKYCHISEKGIFSSI